MRTQEEVEEELGIIVRQMKEKTIPLLEGAAKAYALGGKVQREINAEELMSIANTWTEEGYSPTPPPASVRSTPPPSSPKKRRLGR